ncbi:DUF2924 domain-containing protein [Iodobacter arcticus]|uniref:DUF2924 domain-containing protein n=1 Tax=Iodobacter arcticus TaxID=590593 RepID=A0ABW2R2N7_9NEIS
MKNAEATVSLAAQIAGLASLPSAKLWLLWDQYFPCRPENPNRSHLESRLAYKLQEQALGGLASNTQRRLEGIGSHDSQIKPRIKRPEIHLAPGTVLTREWGERDHKVMVTAEGKFEYEGRQFKSLSAIARHICGTPWSGPLFFGLRQQGAK